EECTRIREQYSSLEIREGTVGEGVIGRRLRQSEIHWIRLNDESQWIYARMAQLAEQANANYRFDIRAISESIQLAEYKVGEYYDWHSDIGSGKTSFRKLSLSVQLSDPTEYEGGDLEFFRITDTPATGQGSCIAFPSFLRHRVTPVTRGIRFSLVAWVSGPPFK
ncbi:MAG: 2OG-Fe(II) oxygenase, partial [Gemmataceae bacterium]